MQTEEMTILITTTHICVIVILSEIITIVQLCLTFILKILLPFSLNMKQHN